MKSWMNGANLSNVPMAPPSSMLGVRLLDLELSEVAIAGLVYLA